MKKIALVLVELSPLAAGESWIGASVGPSFDMLTNEGSTIVNTDLDINFEGAWYFNEAETLGIGAKLGFGITMNTSVDGNDVDHYPFAGASISPAITFQYRLGLTDDLSVRLGAGLQYNHVFGEAGTYNDFEYSCSLDSMDIIANTDVAYNFGSLQIFGGADLGFSLFRSTTTTINFDNGGSSSTSDNLEGFGFYITPGIGVAYVF